MPNFNNEPVLRLVLDRLATNTTYANVELVFVDDGSTDRSREIVRRWDAGDGFAGQMRLIVQPNRGAIAALNAALGAAGGEFCVQIDSDASIETPSWIERLLDFMLIDDRVGLVTGKVVMDSGALHTCGVNVVGPAGWHDRPAVPLEPMGHRRWHHRVSRPLEGEGGDAERLPAEVDAGIGCCMMFRRAEALAAGGYDTGYAPVWFDDVDLCMSIRRLGRKVFYSPDVRVIHHLSARSESVARPSRLRPRRFGPAFGRGLARHLPIQARGRVEDRLQVDLDGHFTKQQLGRLDHHYRYWRQKWGWDVRNPDMAVVERRWGDTEVCWSTDPERKAAGESIVRAYQSARAAGPP